MAVRQQDPSESATEQPPKSLTSKISLEPQGVESGSSILAFESFQDKGSEFVVSTEVINPWLQRQLDNRSKRQFSEAQIMVIIR